MSLLVFISQLIILLVAYAMNHRHCADDTDDNTILKSTRKGSFRDLNVWLVGKIVTSRLLPDRTAKAYAQYPWSNSSTDGIVLDRAYLPKSIKFDSNAGVPLIHEVGHWLGLNHTFVDPYEGYDCAKISALSSDDIKHRLDDGLSDTPLGVSLDIKNATGAYFGWECMQVCLFPLNRWISLCDARTLQ